MGRSIRNKPKNKGGGSTVSNAQLQSKADASTVTALQTTVNGLDTDLGSLTTTVNGKADTSTVTALQTTVNGKASQSALDTLSNTVNTKVTLHVSDTEYAISKGVENSIAFGDVNGPSSPLVYDALSYLNDGDSATGCVAEMGAYSNQYFDIILETDRDVIAKRVILYPVSLPSTSNWTVENFGTTTVLENIYPELAQLGYEDAGVVTMLGSVSNVGAASSGHDFTVSHNTGRRRWVVRVWGRYVEDISVGETGFNTVSRFFLGLSKIDFEYDFAQSTGDVLKWSGSEWVTGSVVEANPSTAATTDLTKLTVGSTTYDIPTGTIVEANPTASGTTDLTKLKVGSTTYDIPTAIPSARFKLENNTSYYNQHTVLIMANNTERKIAFSFEHNSLNLTKDSNHDFYLPPGKYIITAQIDYRMPQTGSSAVRFKLNKGTTNKLYAYEYYHYKQEFKQYLNQGDLTAGFAHATISGLIESTSVDDAYNFTVFYDGDKSSGATIHQKSSQSERSLGWIMKVE